MGLPLHVKRLGLTDYVPVWREMQKFTLNRQASETDQLWLLQHKPVFTLGMNGKMDHVRAPGAIPVQHVDRGGQVTYHGPGQLVVYALFDLRRLNTGVRSLVEAFESSVIEWLRTYEIEAHNSVKAPGVYVRDAKIAALGFRIKRGCSYHGLSINVDMDLEPFSRINPCGYEGMKVTQLSEHNIHLSVEAAADAWLPFLMEQFDSTALEPAELSPLRGMNG